MRDGHRWDPFGAMSSKRLKINNNQCVQILDAPLIAQAKLYKHVSNSTGYSEFHKRFTNEDCQNEKELRTAHWVRSDDSHTIERVKQRPECDRLGDR